MSIYLVDNLLGGIDPAYSGGHNLHYLRELSNLPNTQIYKKREDFISIKKNLYKAIHQKKTYIKPLIGAEVVHFLHLDVYYTTPGIFRDLRRSGTKIVGTLHWFPNNTIKLFMLKSCAEFLDTIVVHSEYTKIKLNKAGINNVVVVDYPAFFIPNTSMKIEDTKNEKIKLLCIGQTRYDKGLDILCAAFKHIDPEIKNKLEFNLVGKEQDIKYSIVKEEADFNNITIIVNNSKVSDEEYWENIYSTDVIVLPYRKIFTGNSGPMTDGIYANKYIIGPNSGNLGYMIENYNLGDTFIQENPQDLGNVISQLIKKDLAKNHIYREEITLNKFKFKYEKIYRELTM